MQMIEEFDSTSIVGTEDLNSTGINLTADTSTPEVTNIVTSLLTPAARGFINYKK